MQSISFLALIVSEGKDWSPRILNLHYVSPFLRNKGDSPVFQYKFLCDQPTNQHQIFLDGVGLAARQKAKLFDYFLRPKFFYIKKFLCLVKFCGSER